MHAVLRRARSEGRLMLAAWALLVCAVGLVAATVTLSDAVTLGGLRLAIRGATPADRIVDIRLPARPSDVPALATALAPELTRTLDPVGGEVVGIARAGGLVVTSGSGGSGAAGTQLASFDHLEAHAPLVSGRWPVAGARPVEAVVSEGGAAALGVAVGSHLTVADSLDRSLATVVTVVGIVRPAAGDPYWAGSALETTGLEERAGFGTRGPLFVTRADLLASAPRDVDLEWRLLPDIDAIRTDDIAPLSDAVSSLPDRLGAILPVAGRPTVSTGLPAILGALEESMLVTRTGVLLLALQFGILAGYAIVLVAGVLVDRRREEARMLRARGASGGHVVRMAIAEAVLLSAAAAIAAPFVALAAVAVVASAGLLGEAGAPVPLDSRLLLVSGLAAAACVPALVLPTLASVAGPEVLRPGRAPTTTLPQRIGIDLVLVVLAGVALWQLGRYGAPLTRDARGVLGIDPLLVGAPAIGLLAGAVLAVRLVPRLGELLEHLLERTRGLTGALGGRQLGRRPLRYSRVALLLILAVAFGTYALADAATWYASQADQAAYQTVGDIRVIPAGTAAPTAATAYRAIPGVTASVPAIRASATTGTLRDGQLLAVDPTAAMRLGAEGWTAGAASLLTAARPSNPGMELPAGTKRLSVTIDAALTKAAFGGELDPAWRGIGLSVVLLGADGSILRATGGDAAFGGGRQRLEVALEPTATAGGTGPATPLTPPVRLAAVELTFSINAGQIPAGTVDILGIGMSDATAGDGWTEVGREILPPAWGWSLSDTRGSVAWEPPAGQPDRIVLPFAEPFAGTPGDFLDGAPAVLRLAPRTTSGAVPAIASPAFLTATGTAVGDELAIRADAVPLTIRIAASAERMAPLDPSAAWIVLDGPTLALRRLLGTGDVLQPAEVWLAVTPGDEARVLSTLRAEGTDVTSAQGRAETAAALRRDPVAIGLIAALGLGALAAAAFAVIGYLAGASATAAERVREVALLEALGLSGREVRRGLLLDQAFVLAVGLGGGLLLGLVLAWFVLPVAILAPDGTTPVPPPAVVVPWTVGIPLIVAALLLLWAGVAVAARSLGGRSVAELLRDWGE